MKFAVPWLLGMLLSVCRLRWDPFPAPGHNPFLDLIALNDPLIYHTISVWYYLAPWAAAGVGGAVLVSAWQIWFSSAPKASGGRGSLPSWPLTGRERALSLVVGETHHRTEPVESERPGWLVIGEKGLFTGMAVVGAIGTGKTSACMHPFAEQLFSWQASDEERKTAGLVLEVKGDFCHSIRKILEQAGRGEDYLEIGLDSPWQWNPLDAEWMDSYSLAYTIAGLMNQLFGKSREPFWQMAAMNLVRNILELHRIIEAGWVTLGDIYRCTINPDLLAERITEARRQAASKKPAKARILIQQRDAEQHNEALASWQWQPEDNGRVSAEADDELGVALNDLGIDSETVRESGRSASPRLAQLEAVERWFEHDWQRIDPKLRTSIVEGISVFLGLFDQPEVARVFCPSKKAVEEGRGGGKTKDAPTAGVSKLRPLPSLQELIESGKVVCLNMPSSANPALSRAIGVMLKQSWLQALLLRPAEMARAPRQYFRPAVFLCDEYQAFATVGENDPCGDEKAFALSRQSRCVPIVATQSISSLRSVTGTGEAWRTLLQTLRTKVFLSLSDDASARIAEQMCGQVERLKASYSYNESTPKAGFSLFSGAPGGGRSSLGTSKSYAPRREALFHSKVFAELDTCQAIVLPFDGKRNQPARRVYLKPYFLPRDLGYWRQRERRLI